MNGLQQLTEPQLEGDAGQERLEALLHAARPQVYRWALIRTGDADEAEDLTQRVLLRVAVSIHSFEGRSRFTTWLYRLMLNAAAEMDRQRGFLERLRARLRAHGWLQSATAPDPLAEVEGERVRRNVEQLLSRLPVVQRQAFDLIDLQGMSPGEAAELLSIRAGTLRVNLLRARRAMRRYMLESRMVSGREESQ